ncbi:transketolase [Marinimicrococcus flavescens]|uniref:Transketolase n=1 Tax=Marinimicrococcus flavescens TaxID=3031815 RepID=A0AAP3XRK7_9PROT|nr:transketolase [Marinimicrococcus flavescens]
MSHADVSHNDLANAIRALAMDAVERAKSGHPGMPMGMADVATVLFTRHLKFDPTAPHWADRDRFVLSAGHGSMLLYALLHLTGYPEMTLEELKNFRQLGARTAGHPEFGHAAGIETTTGPLGQGIATAVGMALGEALLSGEFGRDLVDHHTYVIAGDGCLMEGISHEAASLAGHLGLGRLIVLYDDNEISIDGPTSLALSDDALLRFQSYGWDAERVDGHDPEAVHAAIERAKASPRPSLIACRTVIAKGAPKKAGTAASHGAPLGAEEIEGTRKALGWPHAPFEVPEPIMAAWRAAGARGAAVREEWKQRLAASAARAEFERRIEGRLPESLGAAVAAQKERLVADKPGWASRKSSQEALKVLTETMPELLGGSADLTGSNLTNTPSTAPVTAGALSGRHIHYGVREHAMIAAMNGLALHGGYIPYGGTFLVFTDYCRPSLRLAALMQQRIVMVGTHDSIGLGEDGPTHQPVEHLASLRAIPNMLVFRPADAVETLECWQAALENDKTPSVLALSRQNLPTLRTEAGAENLSARGAYVLAATEGARDATILATGSEVAIAMEARELLASEGIAAAVVSMPSFELFERQEPAWRSAVLGTAPRVAVEAASPFGWTRYVASEDDVVGMKGFGASAPAPALYEHFGITPAAVAARVKALLGKHS